MFLYLEQVADTNNLLDGAERVKKASGWKEMTQHFYVNKLRNAVNTHNEILNETYKQEKGYSFILNEQGRKRKIKALRCTAMMVQHSLCNSVIIPNVRKHLIHDSGASLKGKGISFTRKRFEQHLHEYYRKYGNDGYILLIDFRKFFDNIQHEKLLEMYYKLFKEDKFIEFIEKLLKAYEIDTDGNINDIYNALEDNGGKNHLRKSIGIGAPLSQITGLYFPSSIDSYCKTVARIRYYGAYVDDRYIIHRDKNYLKNLLKVIGEIAKNLGIHIHKNKTQIIKLSHGFTFLKVRYLLTNTGKLIKKIPKDVIVRHKRKMNKLILILNKYDFKNWYKSWRGDKENYDAYNTLKSVDYLYWRLTHGNIF